MSILRSSSSLVLAGVLLPAFFASRASAASITILHMDINAVTISATGSNGSNAFSTGFSGNLTFNTNNFSSLFADIDGDPFVGYNGQITSFTGNISLVNGGLTGGSVAVTVETGAISDTYSYDIVTGSGEVTRSPIPIVFSFLGYNLAGLTDNGAFTGTDFGGVDVSDWVNDEPLLGAFFQFHYRPDKVTGVDTNGDVELYVLATSPSNSPSVPLPTSLLSGVVGLGLLGAYRWRRGRQMQRNS